MFEEVKAILVEQLHLDPAAVVPEARIKDDLGADSLDILQLLMAIEETRGITIPDEELAAFDKVQDIVSYLESRQ